MNIVFLGMNTSFSAVHLLALRDVCAVKAAFVCRQHVDYRNRLKNLIYKAAGRVSSGGFSLEKTCRVYGIDYVEVDSVNSSESISRIKAYHPELICMAGFSEKLGDDVLHSAPKGVINSHPSILPEFRGAHPFYWMVRTGKINPGCTIHKVDNGWDTGPILKTASFPIIPGCNLNIYNSIASVEGGRLMAEVVQSFNSTKEVQHDEISKLNCRTPHNEDLVVDETFLSEQVLWLYNAFSDTIDFVYRSAGREMRFKQISVKFFPGSTGVKFSDRDLYILPA
jgi:methionyl-tRNA formyltransferase